MAGFVAAKQEDLWRRDYKVSVPLVDTMSLEKARSVAFSKVRVLASEEFGAVTLVERVKRDEAYSERTRVVMAGLTRLRVKSEQARSPPGDTVVMDYEIEAEISPDELERQLAAMRSDALRDQQLMVFKRETEILQRRLEEERAGRPPAAQGEPVRFSSTLLASVAREAATFTQQPTSFARGTLLQLAAANEADSRLAADIERALFEPVRNAAYHVEIASVRPEASGVAVVLRFSWRTADILGVRRLIELTGAYTAPYGVVVEGVCALVSRYPEVVQAALARDFYVLEVALGGHVERFMVSGPVRAGHYCLKTGNLASHEAVMRLSRSEAADAGSMTSKLVRTSALAPGWEATLRMEPLEQVR